MHTKNGKDINTEVRFNFVTEINCCLTGHSKYSEYPYFKKTSPPFSELLSIYCLLGKYIKPSPAGNTFALGMFGSPPHFLF